MSLSDIINISITPTTLGVTREGFGLMLILSPNATWSDRVRWYSTLAEISDDGFATDGPEYLAAEKVLSQPVHPPTIGIGRLANAPTQKYTITPTAVNSTKYTINVNGTDYSYTSDSSATAAEIVTGLSAALPVISGVTYGGSTTLTITQGSAGDWLQVAVADPSLLSLVMDATDAGGSSGVAADLDAILLADNTWYAVINLFNSAAIASAIAAWCESNDRLFICDSQDSPIVQVADGSDSTSIAAVVKSNSYRYTAVIYHANNGDFVAAAWAARCLPLNPGSETWAYKNLVGVTADTLTTTQRTNVLAKNASCYISLAGVSHTEFGQVGSSTYKYIDIVRLIDWMRAEMQADIFTDLVSNDKVPFDDDGIALVKNRVRGVLQRGYQNKALEKPTPAAVSAPLVKDVSDADKAARTLNNVNFTAQSSGAIHKVTIAGSLSF